MGYIDFIQKYRRFRAKAQEELGNVDESILIQLFHIYLVLDDFDIKKHYPNVDNYAFDPYDNPYME